MTKFSDKYRIESTRLKGWDYSTPGYYFVTICTRGHEVFFGVFVNGEVQLSPIGKTADRFWREIPEHFPNIAVDEYGIIPNYVHGIINIKSQPIQQPDPHFVLRTCFQKHGHINTQHILTATVGKKLS
ncbi:MAG: hypothetical protein MUO76_21455 [Anaerolineaceae bacterium]|nr:hypothetical protein [Anaerolineaceae bacterium]